MELTEIGAFFDQVGHRHIDGLETGRVEGGGHFYLAVDALLP